MKRKWTLTCWILALICSSFTLSEAQDGNTNPRMYLIYNGNGEAISFDEMITNIKEADYILFGEEHNNPVAHWLELKVSEALYQYDASLVIGLEMLESDIQIVVNEYLADLISKNRYLKEARHWDNYETDYDPIVSFAKASGLRIVATNVPRRYADLMNKKGEEVLSQLSDIAKSYMAPLPIKVEPLEGSPFEMMLAMGGSDVNHERAERLQSAQSLKDATMAWRITQNKREGTPFLHIHGRFHSDGGRGIPFYLSQFDPHSESVSISTVRQDDITSLEEANKEIADYVIVVPSDMVLSY